MTQPALDVAPEIVPVPTAHSLPFVHDLLAPGIASQVQAAHDFAVASLEVLLAESRQDADRNAEIAARNAAQVDAYLSELRAARRVIEAASALVKAWDTFECDGAAAVELTRAVRGGL